MHEGRDIRCASSRPVTSSTAPYALNNLQVSCSRALSRAARASPNGRDIPADVLARILRAAQFAVSDSDVQRLCDTCPGSSEKTVNHRELVQWLDSAPALATGRQTADRLKDTLTTASPWQVRARVGRAAALIAANLRFVRKRAYQSKGRACFRMWLCFALARSGRTEARVEMR